MKKLLIVFLFVSAVGCQSAFRRDGSYVTKQSGRVSESHGCRIRQTVFSDRLRLAPCDAPADVDAEFVCDVELPTDEPLAVFADDCLATAYRHMRGEERKDISATGAAGVRDAFFADYREWFGEEWESVKSGDVPAYVGDWGCQVVGKVVYSDKRYFSYRVTIDTMTGGPHPNRWIQNATYSRKSGRRLAVADVIKKEKMTDVVNLIRKSVLSQAQEDLQLRGRLEEEICQPYEDYVRDIRSRKRDEWGNPLVTDNFMLTKDGIAWVYNQYEIACYASGIFEALLTWSSLGPHLREGVWTGTVSR